MSFETGKNLTGADKISGKAPVSDKSGERTRHLSQSYYASLRFQKSYA